MNPTPTEAQYHLTVGTSAIQLNTLPHSIQTVVF
jgi:hypothetical protein